MSNQTHRKWIFFVSFLTLALALFFGIALSKFQSSKATASRNYNCLSYQDIAIHYAPIIKQFTATDQDYITALNFDNDWQGNNNWQNQPAGDLSAYVYYSVVETETHLFLFYLLYHPRDYTDEDCSVSNGCHENDAEALQIAVSKDDSLFGHPVALETIAHANLHLYSFQDDVHGKGLLIEDKGVLDGYHPIVWVEPYGHGIFGIKQNFKMPLTTYISGDIAGNPNDYSGTVPYLLISIYDSLWKYRFQVGDGKIFDQLFKFRGHLLPSAIDGNDFEKDKANTPWGFSQGNNIILARGDWFLDPARAFNFHAQFPEGFSTTYQCNPYLADLDLLTHP